MAHKKAAGSTRLGRDSHSQRHGVKIFGNQRVVAGNIIVRQTGTKYTPGNGVALGKDYTIFAVQDGVVQFKTVMKRKFTGTLRSTRIVNVVAGAPKAAKKSSKKA